MAAIRYVVSVRGREIGVEVTPAADGRLLVRVDGASGPPLEVTLLDNAPDAIASIENKIIELWPNEQEVFVRAERHPVRVEGRGRGNGVRNAARAGAAGTVRAPMPGRIVKVLVEEGATVERGASVVVVEAMKMENELSAPVNGTVVRVFVGAGDAVERGAALVEIR